MAPGTLVAAGLCLSLGAAASAAPVRLVDQRPAAVRTLAPGVVQIDFGRVAFGNLRLLPPPGTAATLVVHFGEALRDGRVDRTPPGTVRYARVPVELADGRPAIVTPPADRRNTEHPSAVRTPAEWGVVLPFRWVEIEGWPGALEPGAVVRRAAFAATWDDDAAAFASSDRLAVTLPPGTCAHVELPAAKGTAGVWLDGRRVAAVREGAWWTLANDVSGSARLEVR